MPTKDFKDKLYTFAGTEAQELMSVLRDLIEEDIVTDDENLKVQQLYDAMTVMTDYAKQEFGGEQKVKDADAETAWLYVSGNLDPLTNYLEEKIDRLGINDDTADSLEEYKNAVRKFSNQLEEEAISDEMDKELDKDLEKLAAEPDSEPAAAEEPQAEVKEEPQAEKEEKVDELVEHREYVSGILKDVAGSRLFGDSTEYQTFHKEMEELAAGKGDPKKLFEAADHYIHEKLKDGSLPSTPTGKKRLLAAIKVRGAMQVALNRQAASEEAEISENAPVNEEPAEQEFGLDDRLEEPDILIGMLEDKFGTENVPDKLKENVRSFYNASEIAKGKIEERCEFDTLFKPSNEVRDVIRYNAFKQAVLNDTFTKDHLIFYKSDLCKSNADRVMGITNEVGYITDRNHNSEFFKKNILDPDGLNVVTEAFAKKLDGIIAPKVKFSPEQAKQLMEKMKAAHQPATEQKAPENPEIKNPSLPN